MPFSDSVVDLRQADYVLGYPCSQHTNAHKTFLKVSLFILQLMLYCHNPTLLLLFWFIAQDLAPRMRWVYDKETTYLKNNTENRVNRILNNEDLLKTELDLKP